MDVRMPTLDGCEATRRIRALPGGDAVKIVAITASAFMDQRGEILQAGCDGIVHKPYRRREVFETMGNLLGLRYVHEEAHPAPAAPRPSRAEARAAVAGLSPVLRGELVRAAQLGDRELFQAGLRAVAGAEPGLAELLRRLSDDYRFDVVLDLLDSKGAT
jgi:CheY-like chemotaxis protein